MATVSACVTQPGAALSTTATSGPDGRGVVAGDAIACGAAAAGAPEAWECGADALGPPQATRPTAAAARDTRVFTGNLQTLLPPRDLVMQRPCSAIDTGLPDKLGFRCFPPRAHPAGRQPVAALECG